MRARISKPIALAATVALGALAAPPATAHEVAPGDTLSRIAAANGTTVRALAEANGISNPNRIIVGQVLVIPGGGSAPATVVHVVAPGESLSAIARRYGTTVNALAGANGIQNPNLVRIGTRLTVPAGSGGGSVAQNRRHIVSRGETLALIARHYEVSQGAIVSANGLANPNLIRVGQVLTIPPAGAGGGGAAGGTGGRSTSGYAATGGADGRTGLSGTHTVAAGETLAAIARRYGVSTGDLMAANGILPPGNLYAQARLQLTARNRLPTDISRCPVPGARFANDWGFPRSAGRAHEGNDMFAPRGTPVLAPVSGTVTHATGTIGGRQFRLVGDDGTTYLGSHMDSFGASGRVRAGDVVGYVGTTGNAAGGTPHLHFEIHPDNGPAMNPYPVLRQACG